MPNSEKCRKALEDIIKLTKTDWAHYGDQLDSIREVAKEALQDSRLSELSGNKTDGQTEGIQAQAVTPSASEKCRKCGSKVTFRDSRWRGNLGSPFCDCQGKVEHEPEAAPSGEPPNVTCTECKTKFFSANDREARCPHCGKHLMLFPAPSLVQAGQYGRQDMELDFVIDAERRMAPSKAAEPDRYKELMRAGCLVGCYWNTLDSPNQWIEHEDGCPNKPFAPSAPEPQPSNPCWMCETEGAPILRNGKWEHHRGNVGVRDCLNPPFAPEPLAELGWVRACAEEIGIHNDNCSGQIGLDSIEGLITDHYNAALRSHRQAASLAQTMCSADIGKMPVVELAKNHSSVDEIPTVQAAPSMDLITRLRYIGGSLRMNLNDAANIYPGHFHAESLKQLIAEWDAVATEAVKAEMAEQAAPRPRCPKCGGKVSFSFDAHRAHVTCTSCEVAFEVGDMDNDETNWTDEFAQFFFPAQEAQGQ